jgi:hypothetical protein
MRLHAKFKSLVCGVVARSRFCFWWVLYRAWCCCWWATESTVSVPVYWSWWWRLGQTLWYAKTKAYERVVLSDGAITCL